MYCCVLTICLNTFIDKHVLGLLADSAIALLICFNDSGFIVFLALNATVFIFVISFSVAKPLSFKHAWLARGVHDHTDMLVTPAHCNLLMMMSDDWGVLL